MQLVGRLVAEPLHRVGPALPLGRSHDEVGETPAVVPVPQADRVVQPHHLGLDDLGRIQGDRPVLPVALEHHLVDVPPVIPGEPQRGSIGDVHHQ